MDGEEQTHALSWNINVASGQLNHVHTDLTPSDKLVSMEFHWDEHAGVRYANWAGGVARSR